MKYLPPVGLFCLLFVAPIYGQKAPPKKQIPYVPHTQFAWTQEAWTADEKPFQSVRVALVMAQQQHKNMLAQAKQYGATAKKKPNDALAVFKWGYAAWLASNYGTNHAANAELFDANNALTKTPSPHSYQYDRLRYLIDACDSQRGVKELGERLIKRNPNDFYVVYYQIDLLTPGLVAADKKEAFDLCNKIIHDYPKDANGYERLASVYQRLWWVSANKTDAQMTIDYYRKGETLLPANNPNRAKYNDLISQTEREMRRTH